MECPGWDKVPALVETLISEWNRNYSSVAADARKLAIPSMARFFHSLLAIHPFIDGNGRLARELLSLQARELLGLEENLLIERGSGYYSALRSADAQEFDALEQLISNAIAGAQRA
jgi:Fic family protein